MSTFTPDHEHAEKRNRSESGFIRVVILFCIAFCLLLSTLLFLYSTRRRELKVTTEAQITTVADLKRDQIEQWRTERLSDAAVFGTNRTLWKALARYHSNEDLITPALRVLATISSSYHYRNALIFDSRKNLVIGTVPSSNTGLQCGECIRAFDSTLATGKATMTDLYMTADSMRTVQQTVFAPVMNPEGDSVCGVLVLVINSADFLFPLIRDWPMPSTTAEVLIVRPEKDSILFCSELRHRKNAMLTMKLPVNMADLPAALAVRGYSGIVEGRDYRRKPVLAAVRHIPGSSWYLVAKIDTEEAYLQLHRLKEQLFIVLFFFGVAFILAGILYYKHRSSELYKRMYAAEREKNTLSESLVQSEQRFKSLFDNMTEGVALHEFVFDERGKPFDYRILEVNEAYERQTGIDAGTAPGRSSRELYGTEKPPYFDEYRKVAQDGVPVFFRTFFPPMKKHFAISVCATGKNRFATVFEDITEKKMIEDERDATLRLLNLLNTKSSLNELMKSVTGFLQEWAGCEAVGIRLKRGVDFPYFETTGFSAGFVEMESSLCHVYTEDDCTAGDAGNPVLDCMCGNVIEGRFDPSKPFFTKKGSFWTNCTTDLLASTGEADRQSRTRNRCNGEGYESVALVRLEFAGTPLGLLQLNDRRKDRFTLPFIELIERFSDNIAIALEQRKNQTDLALQKERLLVTLRSIGDGVISTDTAGRIQLINTVAEELTGYTSAEAVGRPLDEVFRIFNEESRTVCDNPVMTVLEKDGVVGLSNHTLLVNRSGVERVIADSGAPIRDENGVVIGVVIVFRDVTERRRAEQELRDSEERFRTMYEEGRMGVVLTNKSMLFERVNPAFCAMLGYTEEELVGKSFRDVTHPDHVAADVEHVKALIQGKSDVYTTDKRYIRRDGSVMWGSIVIAAVNDAAGECRFLLGMIQDITARKEAEEALLVEKERLRVTLHSIADAVIATDLQGKVMLMNRSAEELTGWKNDEAIGLPLMKVFNLFNAAARTPCADPTEKIIAAGIPTEISEEAYLVGRSGGEIAVAESGAPIFDRNGAITGAVLVFRDITEKQRTEAAIQKTEKLESLGLLAAGIAHDFNNLLSGLFGYIDLARDCSAPDSEAAGYLDKAFTVFGRTKDLTGQLLTFAKGGAPARRTKFLPPLIRDTVQFALSGSSIKCAFAVDEQLWTCDVDENQLSQVIDNLIINARDAMPDGGTVYVMAENGTPFSVIPAMLSPGKYVIISVRDEGTGITPANMIHIFDPFFSTKQKGSGLGLAVSFSIMQRHGGTIEVESEVGKGTKFTLYLPASESVQERSVSENTAGHRGEGEVLILDDEAYIREIATVMLGDMGYRVAAAESGEELISLVRAMNEAGRQIAFVILDLTIPGGMGGMATAAELKKTDSSLLLIASSGYADDPVIAHPEKYGFAGSIGKPYHRSILEKKLEEILVLHVST